MERFVATAVEIMPLLWDRYGGYLRKDLLTVRILHKQGRCYLEITTRRGSDEMHDEAVERIDLSFIGEMEDQPMFPGHVSAFVTARKFVEEFNAYDIINCTPLFTDEAAVFISEQHERTREAPRTQEPTEADADAR